MPCPSYVLCNLQSVPSVFIKSGKLSPRSVIERMTELTVSAFVVPCTHMLGQEKDQELVPLNPDSIDRRCAFPLGLITGC